MEYVEQLVHLLQALNDSGVEYILIGGGALNVHGLVRATQDVDLFIRPDVANVDRLKEALRAVWNDPEIEEISADDLCGDYPALRYGPPTGTFFLDVLTRLGERFGYQDLDYEVVRLGDVDARVATPETLFRMKRDTVRAIDRADALALQQAFGLEVGDDD